MPPRSGAAAGSELVLLVDGLNGWVRVGERGSVPHSLASKKRIDPRDQQAQASQSHEPDAKTTGYGCCNMQVFALRAEVTGDLGGPGGIGQVEPWLEITPESEQAGAKGDGHDTTDLDETPHD
jgi:hypothetical protein